MVIREAEEQVSEIRDEVVQEIVSWRGSRTNAPQGIRLDPRLARFAQQRANEVQSGSEWGAVAVPGQMPRERANSDDFACGLTRCVEIVAYGCTNHFDLAWAICADLMGAGALTAPGIDRFAVGIGGGSETLFVVLMLGQAGPVPSPDYTFNPVASLFTGDKSSLNMQAPSRIVVRVRE
jgi:hypothetical protein